MHQVLRLNRFSLIIIWFFSASIFTPLICYGTDNPITRIRIDNPATVSRSKILLKEIAEIDTSDPAMRRRLVDISLGQSPRPGKFRTLDARHVGMRIKQAGIELHQIDFHMDETIDVFRDSRTISADRIREIVLAHFMEMDAFQHPDIRMADFRVDGPVILPGGPYETRVQVSRKKSLAGTIPLKIIFRSQNGYRRSVRAAAWIENPIVIKRRAIVTILAGLPGLRISALGEAKKDGRMHDRIRVENLDSGRTIYARVVGKDLVRVD